MSDDFSEWITGGPGEAFLGGIIKSAAARVKRRILRRLETPNLFPHLEHEDRVELEKCEQARLQGDAHIKRCHTRKAALDNILDADAGLRITDDDLRFS